MRNKKLLTWVALGAAAWWFWRQQRRNQAVAAAAVSAEQQVPTDSMVPGTIEPAVNGIIKDGDMLSCMNCY